ncbi:MAG: hypothetical protein A2W29_06910, partial [Gemmatimonadetes bacterium RBG_16_66_8]
MGVALAASPFSCSLTTGPDDQETSVRVVDTGQDRCYNNQLAITCPARGAPFYGQDAQHDGLAPRYVNNGDGTITDLNTGIMWQRSPDRNGDGAIDASDKLTFQEAVAQAETFSLAGYTDWRLPTIKELYSLMDFRGLDINPNATSGTVPFIDIDYFEFGYGDTQAGERIIDAQFATSTRYVSTTMDGAATMFGVNFADGRIKGYPTDDSHPLYPKGVPFYVRYVRGNTGYGRNGFTDNGDGTVTDTATGLQWSRDDSGIGLNWEEALAWVQLKDAEAYLGHSDWRLPNIKELQSIVDYSRAPDVSHSAAIDPVFGITSITNEAGRPDYPSFWSSTTHAHDGAAPGGSAAYVCFGRCMGYM